MAIQTSYPRGLEQYRVGQVANTLASKCESGILSTSTAVPFGRAVRWTGENAVTGGADRALYGLVNANINASVTSVVIKDQRPGVRDLIGTIANDVPGDRIVIGSEWMTVTGVSGGRNANQTATIGRGQESTTAASHNAGAVVKLVGREFADFAGVAVRDVTVHAANTPVDTYNQHDIVAVGSAGDFVVEIVASSGIKRGDGVSVYIGSTATNFGMFAKSDDSPDYVSLGNAVFVSDATTAGGKNVAVLRLTQQTT